MYIFNDSMYQTYNLMKQIDDLSGDREPQRIYEIRKIVVDAIVKTFNIDQNKIYTEDNLGKTRILFNKNNIIYDICYFEVDSQSIRIYFEDGIKYAGLGKINAESAEAVAKNIKEKLLVNKEIRIYYYPKLYLLYPKVEELIKFLRA